MSSRDERDPTPGPAPATGDSAEFPQSSAATTRLSQIDSAALPLSVMGSGLLAQQPTPSGEAAIAVAKVCPQCGGEYETGDRFCPRDGSPLRPKTGGDPLVGRVIADRYLILTKLGEGGMGRVYLAEHVKMNRQCAIKVMNPSLVNDPESSARFAREASNAARIIHPNVAAVFDFGESEKIVYLVMEYVDGESLSSALAREGTLSPRRTVEIARQIADGLAAAHELGIVHRDLKPDNVIIARSRSGRETAKVVDFGIAKAASEGPQDALTKSGLVIGTPEYMSPEQLLGDPVDARTDVYALGCILFQMLTGAPAFAAETREQMIRRRLHEPPPHIRDANPKLPRPLDTLIAHMLARSPSDRLGTATAVRDALEPGLVLAGWEDDEAGLRHLSPRNAPTVSRAVSDPSLQPTLPLSVQRRRSAMRVAGGSLAGSAALLIALAVWQRNWPTPIVAGPAPALAHDSVARGSSGARDTTTGVASASDSAKQVVATAPSRGAQPGSRDASKLAAAQRTSALAASPKASAAQRPTDSSAGQISPAPPMRPEEHAARQALDDFTDAMKTGKIEVVQKKFPEMPEKLRDFLSGILSNAEHIKAESAIAGVAINGDSATARYKVTLTYNPRGSGQVSSVVLHYAARVVRHDGRWQIAELRSVS